MLQLIFWYLHLLSTTLVSPPFVVLFLHCKIFTRLVKSECFNYRWWKQEAKKLYYFPHVKTADLENKVLKYLRVAESVWLFSFLLLFFCNISFSLITRTTKKRSENGRLASNAREKLLGSIIKSIQKEWNDGAIRSLLNRDVRKIIFYEATFWERKSDRRLAAICPDEFYKFSIIYVVCDSSAIQLINHFYISTVWLHFCPLKAAKYFIIKWKLLSFQ